jgi:glycolate oxidase FAD binding subunit
MFITVNCRFPISRDFSHINNNSDHKDSQLDSVAIEDLQQQVEAACEDATALAIQGGNTRAYYGREISGEPLRVGGYAGVVDYHPTELVITAKAGTTLAELDETLAEHNQMLGFEPPRESRQESSQSTLGGAIATGLVGPCRPYLGSVQDFVLGIKLLTGEGKVMSFGGQVIKNVAGFDVSRLMVGANGCLGIIVEVSLKVIPRPDIETTLCLEYDDVDDSVSRMNELAGKPLPISAASWLDGVMRIRLSGSEVGVSTAAASIGGEEDSNETSYWQEIRDHGHVFFTSGAQVIRASTKPSAPVFADAPVLVDWGGALRWYCGESVVQDLERHTSAQGGHIGIFRNGNRSGEVFARPSTEIMKYHHRLKETFDPARILNPGRMYADL